MFFQKNVNTQKRQPIFHEQNDKKEEGSKT